MGAGGVPAEHLHPGPPAALARRRRAVQDRRVARAGAAGNGNDRAQPREAVSRHQHADGRAARALSRQPGVRAAAGAADAERSGRPALPDRLRERRQPSARTRRRARPRARNQAGARRRAPPPGAPARHRVADCLGRRRRPRSRRRRGRERSVAADLAVGHPGVRRRACRSHGRPLRPRLDAGRAADVRGAARAARVDRRVAERAGRLRRHPTAPQHPGRRGSVAVDRPRGRRRAAAAQPDPAAARRSGVRAGERDRIRHHAAVGALREERGSAARARRNRSPSARAAGRAGGGGREHAGAARLHVDRRCHDRGPQARRLRTGAAPQIGDAWLFRGDGHPPARRPHARRPRHHHRAGGHAGQPRARETVLSGRRRSRQAS